MLRHFALIVLACLLSAASCRDNEDEGVIPTPIQVTFTSPADSALLEQDAVRNISIDFQRAISTTAEIELAFYPTPSSSGVKRLTLGGRNLTWFDVAPESGTHRQHLLIDGPRVLHPYVVRWYTGPPDYAQFQGDVLTPAQLGPVAQDAIVFAVDPNGAFTPLDPRTFDDVEIRAISAPFRIGDPDDEALYLVNYMPSGAEFYVLAIYDSSGDGLYDPRDDWWGYFRGSNLVDPEIVVARPINPIDPPRGDVDITLRVPSGR